MVYVTARLSFMAILAHSISILLLLLAVYQVADCQSFPGFQQENDIHLGDVIIFYQ